nr:MAG: ORF3 [Torque teno polar bear virus 21]
MISGFRSEEKPQATSDSPGPSKKPTFATPAKTTPVKPASILKGTSTATASSEKKLFRELLALMTPASDVPWRSSPNLFISETPSERNGYRGRMKRTRDQVYDSPSDSDLYELLRALDDE